MKLFFLTLFSFLIVISPIFAETEKITLTSDNVVALNDSFYGTSVAQVIKKVIALNSKLPSGEPIFLVLNSGGGSIDAGIELIEFLNKLNRPVHTITIFSASMGFQTVQGVKGTRYILKNGTLMSHKARGGFYGEFPGQLDSRYEFYLKRILRLDETVVSRTKGKHTMKSYHNLIENEFWCDGKDCIKEGFADKVVEVACDQSLQGTESAIIDKFLFYGRSIVITSILNKCPISTYELDFNIVIDGQPMFVSESDLIKPIEKKDDFYSTSKFKFYLSPAEAELLQEKIKTRLGVTSLENRVSSRPTVLKY